MSGGELQFTGSEIEVRGTDNTERNVRKYPGLDEIQMSERN